MRLLDLFAGVGGAARGYANAGFDVVGVDIEPQPDYPFTFQQLDARELLRMMTPEIAPKHFDAIHASPPCQASCALTKGTNKGNEYEQLIPAVRAELERIGLPYVIENVQGSDLRRDLTLCGEMFGLGVLRHRYFECSFPVVQPAHQPHRGRVRGWRHGTYFDGPYLAVYGEGGGKGTVAEWQTAMGIHWTDDRKSIAEAIPPAYTAARRSLPDHPPRTQDGSMSSRDDYPDLAWVSRPEAGWCQVEDGAQALDEIDRLRNDVTDLHAKWEAAERYAADLFERFSKRTNPGQP